MEGALSFAVETAQNAFKAAKEAPTWAKAALAAAALMALREAYLSATEVSPAATPRSLSTVRSKSY